MSEWRVENNGTGETVSIYAGDHLIADIESDTMALEIVYEHNTQIAALAQPDARDEIERYRRVLRDIASTHLPDCAKIRPRRPGLCDCSADKARAALAAGAPAAPAEPATQEAP